MLSAPNHFLVRRGLGLLISCFLREPLKVDFEYCSLRFKHDGFVAFNLDMFSFPPSLIKGASVRNTVAGLLRGNETKNYRGFPIEQMSVWQVILL